MRGGGAGARPPDLGAALDLGGTIRAAPVAETLARARGAMGAVGITRVGNVTGLDHVGVPTWLVVRPQSRSLTVSQGKGLTHELAQVSGIMESIELHHAEHFVPRGRMLTLAQATRDVSCANPLLLPIRSSARLRQNSRAEWIDGADLMSGRRRRVPRDCVRLGPRASREPAQLFAGSSNGLASGNTRTEALLHAVCELIERDQASLWLARRQLDPDAPAARLRLASVSDPDCRSLIDRCDAAGLRLAVWHVSVTMAVPCFMSIVFDPSGRTFYPQRASGFGCHPYRRIALARAITEALQSRLTHIAGGRDDVYWSDYRDAIRIDDASGAAWARNHDAEPQVLDFNQVPQAPAHDRIDDLLADLLAALAKDGLAEAIAVDLTQEGLGIPVVHVTVPGLEALIGKAGYSPGPRMQRLLAQYLN
jgi:ribosomal protein S12 methylthiotransferase accessory factor